MSPHFRDSSSLSNYLLSICLFRYFIISISLSLPIHLYIRYLPFHYLPFISVLFTLTLAGHTLLVSGRDGWRESRVERSGYLRHRTLMEVQLLISSGILQIKPHVIGHRRPPQIRYRCIGGRGYNYAWPQGLSPLHFPCTPIFKVHAMEK